jgi:rubrerythrin
MSSTYRLFELAEGLEVLAASIYRAAAEAFSWDATARALFIGLAHEEEQHASRVRLLAARYRGDPRLVPAGVADLGELEALQAEGEAILAAIRAGEWGRDLARAREKLAALEWRFQRAHAQSLARHSNPALREFFDQLAGQDEAHWKLLGPEKG